MNEWMKQWKKERKNERMKYIPKACEETWFEQTLRSGTIFIGLEQESWRGGGTRYPCDAG